MLLYEKKKKKKKKKKKLMRNNNISFNIYYNNFLDNYNYKL